MARYRVQQEPDSPPPREALTIFVITGPPASGKSTWVKQHATPGRDITIDYDELANALTAQPPDNHEHAKHIHELTLTVRRAAINAAIQLGHAVNVYIIDSYLGPQAVAQYEAVGATLIVIDPGRETVLARCRDERPAHRLSYKFTRGPIPDGMQIDHICHNRACVNPEHLRLATNKQNMENPAGLRVDNTSGHQGVTWDRSCGKWKANVHHNGRNVSAGRYASKEAAAQAVARKRCELFTHNDADREARLNVDAS